MRMLCDLLGQACIGSFLGGRGRLFHFKSLSMLNFLFNVIQFLKRNFEEKSIFFDVYCVGAMAAESNYLV